MPITFIDVVETAVDPPTGTTTYDVTKPTNAATGDLMVTTITFADATFANPAPTLPTGWTQINVMRGSGGNDSDGLNGYRFLQAGDPSTWTTGSTMSAGAATDAVCIATGAYRGVDTASPILGSLGAVNLSSGTTIDSGNVNNTDAGAWVLGLTGAHNVSPTTISVGAASDAQTVRGTGAATLDVSDWGYARLYDSNGPVATGNVNHVTDASAATANLYATVVVLRPALVGVSYVVTEEAVKRASRW